MVAVRKHPGVETPGYYRVVPAGTGRAGSPLPAERPNANGGRPQGPARTEGRALPAAFRMPQGQRGAWLAL